MRLGYKGDVSLQTKQCSLYVMKLCNVMLHVLQLFECAVAGLFTVLNGMVNRLSWFVPVLVPETSLLLTC